MTIEEQRQYVPPDRNEFEIEKRKLQVYETYVKDCKRHGWAAHPGIILQE